MNGHHAVWWALPSYLVFVRAHVVVFVLCKRPACFMPVVRVLGWRWFGSVFFKNGCCGAAV